jgi:hypothetical protein
MTTCRASPLQPSRNSASHAGHGPSGDIALFDAQLQYILAFENLVWRHLQRGALSDQDKAVIRTAIIERFPGYPLEFLIDLNTEAMARSIPSVAGSGLVLSGSVPSFRRYSQ